MPHMPLNRVKLHLQLQVIQQNIQVWWTPTSLPPSRSTSAALRLGETPDSLADDISLQEKN